MSRSVEKSHATGTYVYALDRFWVASEPFPQHCPTWCLILAWRAHGRSWEKKPGPTMKCLRCFQSSRNLVKRNWDELDMNQDDYITLNGWMIRRRNICIKLLSRNCRREPCFCDSAILLRQVPQNLSNIGMMDWTATWGELLGRLRFSPEFLPMKLFHHEDWFSLDCEETSWMDLWRDVRW